jgi:hypothetical protein
MNEKVFFVRVSKKRHHISFSCDQMGQDSARCTSDSGAFQFRDRVGLRSNLVSDVNFGSKADIPRCNLAPALKKPTGRPVRKGA